jgi:hypothetical protein
LGLTGFAANAIVLPYMPSLVAKKKGNKLYYYVVESARALFPRQVRHAFVLAEHDDLALLFQCKLTNDLAEFG